MEGFVGWAADPAGVHKARYFRNGQPTTFVWDGGQVFCDDRSGGSPPPSLRSDAPTAWSHPASPSAAPLTSLVAPVTQQLGEHFPAAETPAPRPELARVEAMPRPGLLPASVPVPRPGLMPASVPLPASGSSPPGDASAASEPAAPGPASTGLPAAAPALAVGALAAGDPVSAAPRAAVLVAGEHRAPELARPQLPPGGATSSEAPIARSARAVGSIGSMDAPVATGTADSTGASALPGSPSAIGPAGAAEVAAWTSVPPAAISPTFSTRPRPLSRRPLAAVSAVLVALMVAGGFVLFGPGSTKSAQAEVISAVDGTMAHRTAAVTFQSSADVGAQAVSMTGSGVVDFTGHSAELHLSVPGTGVSSTALYVGGTVYESIGSLAQGALSRIAPGKSWVSVDAPSGSMAGGQTTSMIALGSNPAADLRLLAERGDQVTRLGTTTIDGVGVQGYSVSFNDTDIHKVLGRSELPAWERRMISASLLHDATYRVFVDSGGRLRRVSLDLTLDLAPLGAGTVSLQETMDLTDYGTPVSVVAPPADQVVTLQQLLTAAKAVSATGS